MTKFAVPLALATLTFSPAAFGQAEGIMKQDAATSGKTDVATSGFAAPVKDEPDAKDTSEAKVSAGALLSSGNSRSVAATSAAQLRVRRGHNQFSGAAAVNYARSAADRDSGMETTVENYQGKIRYDRFIGEGFALFLASSARRDEFQGLNLRLNVDPGVAYYVIDEKKHQLWSELGYDLQYDVRRDENIAAAAATGEDVDKTDVQHSGRLFVGYNNALNERVTFTTGVEYLQGIPETERWRLNWDAGVSSAIAGKFSLSTTFSLKYDHAPLPEVEDLDLVTAVNLVYQLL